MSFIFLYGGNKISVGVSENSDLGKNMNSFLSAINSNQYLDYDEHNDVCYYPIFKACPQRPTAFSCDLSHKLTQDELFSSVPKRNIITIQGDAGLNFDKNGNYCFQHQTRKFLYINPRDIFSHFDNWYSPNLKQKLGKIMPVPVGVYPAASQGLSPEFIQELRAIPKTKLCYCNMSITSRYRAAIAKWANKCSWVDDFIFKRSDFVDREYVNDPEIVFEEHSLDFKDYMRKLASYKFAITPEGHGIDTFRVWECVMTNTIPIVYNNYGNQIFSQIFPMMLTNRYETITEDQLNLVISQPPFSDLNYDCELLQQENLHKLLGLIKNACNRA